MSWIYVTTDNRTNPKRVLDTKIYLIHILNIEKLLKTYKKRSLMKSD